MDSEWQALQTDRFQVSSPPSKFKTTRFVNISCEEGKKNFAALDMQYLVLNYVAHFRIAAPSPGGAQLS